MRKLRIGFVGVGFMGQLAHLANYAALNECEVVAIAEPRRELAEKVARRYGVERIYPDHRALLESCQVDALVASQPYRRHAVLVPDLLRAKVPVFTEKPISLTVEAGESLARLADASGVLYMVGYHKRSDPAMVYARRIVDEWKASGEYGRMRYVRVTMPPGDWIGGGAAGVINTAEEKPAGDFEPMPDYFDDATAQFYSSFVNFYIHQVNILRFILGEPYAVTFAEASGVLLTAESASGVCGTIEMAPYQTTIDWQERVFVGFEKGYIDVRLPPPLAGQEAGRVTVMRDKGDGPSLTRPILPRVSAMRQQAANFLAAVRGERPAPCAAAEAVEDLRAARRYVELFVEARGRKPH